MKISKFTKKDFQALAVLLGPRWGKLFEGFLGGLVSSTAVTAKIAVQSKVTSHSSFESQASVASQAKFTTNEIHTKALLASLLMALLAMTLEMGMIVYLGSSLLFRHLAGFILFSSITIVVISVGLFELHGLSLVTAQMLSSGGIDLNQAVNSMMVASAAAYISKVGLILISGDHQFAKQGAVVLSIVYGLGFLGFCMSRFFV